MSQQFASKKVVGQGFAPPQAVKADDTSVNDLSSLGRSHTAGKSHPQLASFQDPMEENKDLPSIMDSCEFGMPMTEDADNLPTMA